MNALPKFSDFAPTAEAAQLRKLMRRKDFPTPHRIGMVNFYRRSDLIAWRRKRAKATA